VTLLIIATGGTIDKSYAPGAGTRELENNETQIPAILAQARVHAYAHTVLLAKDSLDITDPDRQHIAAFCADVPETRLLITHGTDSMVATAAAIAAHPGNAAKTIVLTGASKPWCLKNSDADFNLGFASGVANFAPAGIWVAMNGQAHPHHNVTKNPATGMFEASTKVDTE
jgi:L-asparaginase